ncbi:unnamed protein product, partial [Hapterophycus canaliculatus]
FAASNNDEDRDLKPANILLLNDCQLRITDFGLSAQRCSLPPVSEDGVSTWYRAPEVILGSKERDGKPMDIWSVGCIFGEMLGSPGPLFPGKHYVDQVSLMLAALGKPDTMRKDSLGYELGEDTVQLLRTVEHPTGRALESLLPSDVDENAFDLLKTLLGMDRRRRMTAEQALDHVFFRDCPRLPRAENATVKQVAAVATPVARVKEGAVDFSFEDDDLTVEELGRLIAAESTWYEKSRHKSCRRNESLEADTPPSFRPLRPIPTLQVSVGSKQLRASKKAEDNTVGNEVTAVPRLRLGNTSHTGAAFAPPFTSMANLANAEGRGIDGLEGSFSDSTAPDLEMGSVSPDTATERPRVSGSDPSGSNTGHPTGGRINSSIEYTDAEAGQHKRLLRREGVDKATAAPRRAEPQPPRPPLSLPPKRKVDQRDGCIEEERAAFVIQKSHRQAASIRRARVEQERNLKAQQFLFGPGFQQPTCRTTRSSGGESGRYSERRERSRDKASLTPSEEEDERLKSNNRAATRIQAHARRKAASHRRETMASVPRLPIESSALFSAFPDGRSQVVAPKVQREPLAILRQLRDNPEVQPAPKTDQFRLRMTIKSAIEAHIKKAGAPRRKPHPLPTALSYRQNAALMKLKSQQQQQQLRADATRAPLTKRRAVSPLHRSVRHVNTFVSSADKRRGRPTAGPGPRAPSAPPSRATDRLRCAIYAAETMVEREYERAQKRPSPIRDTSPVDEVSRDLLASPLLVPYSPPS